MYNFPVDLIDKIIEYYLVKNGLDNTEPLDGDETETLVRLLQADVDLEHGNITEKEHHDLSKNLKSNNAY
jgi:hypothetical protein